jgi:hypothetical protein
MWLLSSNQNKQRRRKKQQQKPKNLNIATNLNMATSSCGPIHLMPPSKLFGTEAVLNSHSPKLGFQICSFPFGLHFSVASMLKLGMSQASPGATFRTIM